MACEFKATFARYKPHLTMLLSQICYAIVYFFTEAAFSQGLNPHIYVTYRFCLAGCLMFPFAYFLERKSRPKLTYRLFSEFFLLSLIGSCSTLNMYFASLKYTSPTFVASLFNTVPSWTFVIAIILRMEVVDVKNPRGIAKVLGTLISLAGVTTITLYKGPALQSLWAAPIHIKRLSVHENWVKGSILTVASCITWAIWYIMQAITLKKYPTQVSLAAWMNGIGGAQSAVFAVCLQHKASAWSIKMFSVNFWSITYSGICSAVFVFLQIWCMKEKGPVFVAMFNSLQTLTVVVLAYFVLGERLYTGRESRPKLTLALFLEIFLVSLLGITLTYNMFFTSMRCTSPTFVAAVFNTVSSLTFIMAILFRMEVVVVKSHRGIAKILGTLISLAGVTIITLYKGPALQSLWDTPIHMKTLSIHENWVKGSILTIASCITWASWYIMQTFTMKKYPAELSLTAWMNCIGGAQSAVFAVSVQHKPAAWSITMFSIGFWAITYCGIVGSGLIIFLQLWCMKEKGPVFVSMFTPLQTVMVAVLAYFVFGEKLYTGSILGGVTVIIGLYLLLWGKEKDQPYIKSQEQSSSHSEEIEVADKEEVASAVKEEP